MKDPRICERHFVGGDYHPDAMINGNLNTKRLDKSKAIPSRNLGLNERMKNEMNNDQIMQDQGQSLMAGMPETHMNHAESSELFAS